MTNTAIQQSLAEIMEELRKLQTIVSTPKPKTMTYKAIANALEVSESTARRMLKQPGAPKPRKFQTDDDGQSVTRYVASEIDAWIERKPSRAR